MRKHVSVPVTAYVGALILSLTAVSGMASADPSLGAAINTTCTYTQVVAALNAQAPAAAQQFAAAPQAQTWLRAFLAAPPSQQPVLAQQVQSIPAATQFGSLVPQVVRAGSDS